MRLSIQGCLILLLCFYSSFSFADWKDYLALPFSGTSARCVGNSGASYCKGEWQTFMTGKYNTSAKVNFVASYITFFPRETCGPSSICNSVIVKIWVGPGPISEVDCTVANRTCDGDIPGPVICESPNFIDPVSGECLPPKEICFTTIENMQNECVYIGTDDPTAPEGCVVDAVTGAQICLSEEPGCYVADGKTICPTPDMVCGVKNGTFSCVAPEQEGCGYFNGERVCFSPDGQKVDNTSPDHPDNGGNLDGDDTNDPKDPRPVDQGGDSENQVDNGKGNATEKTALNQLNEQKNINKNLKSIDNSIKSLSSSLTQDVGAGDLSLIENSVKNPLEPGSDLSVAFDSHIDAIDTNKADVGVDMVQGIGTKVTGLVSQGACSELSYTSALTSFSLGCEKTKKIRDLLSWVLYLLTVWVCFSVITEPTTRRG